MMIIRSLFIVFLSFFLLVTFFHFFNFQNPSFCSHLVLGFEKGYSFKETSLPRASQELTLFLEKGDLTTFILHNPGGCIEVQGMRGDDLKIKMMMTVYAKEQQLADDFLKQIHLKEERRDFLLEILLLHPDNLSIEAKELDFTIYVPKGMALDISNSYGDLLIEGMTSRIILQSHHSDRILLRDLKGDLDLLVHFGQLEILELQGDLRGEIGHSHALIQDVLGEVNLQSKHSQLTLKKIGGPLWVQASHDYLMLGQVEGPISIMCSHSHIIGENLLGDLLVEASHGRLDLRDLSGRVSIKARFTNTQLHLQPIVKGYTLDLQSFHGSINSNIQLTKGGGGSIITKTGLYGGGQYPVSVHLEYGNLMMLVQ